MDLEEIKLPANWRGCALREACVKTSLWNPEREQRESFTYVDVSAVSNVRFCITAPQVVHGANAPSRARKIIRAGDVIYATVRPSLKRVAWVEPPYDDQIASTAFCVVRANPEQAESKFLYYLLLTDEVNRKIVEHEHGASYPAVTDKDVLNRFILLPPLSEQRKIVLVLWKVQQAVHTEAAIVHNARDLKKSLLHRLFTHGLRGEPLKETELGPLPESWRQVTVRDLGEVVTGTTPPTGKREYYEPGQYQFIAPGDLGSTIFINTSGNKISGKGLKVSRVLPKHSVCFVCIGSSIGKVGITVDEESTTNQQINSIIASKSYEPFFIGYLLEHWSEHIATHASPSPVPIMSKGKFEEVKLFAPPELAEQREIANILRTVDEKIAVHEAKQRALQDLFKTLLHQLMTAQLRVNHLDIDLRGAEVRP